MGRARKGVVAAGLLVAFATLAGDAAFPRPGPRDKCPVCGMFVARYPDWTAAVVLRGGTTLYFDGAKDLFKFLASPGTYTRDLAAVEGVLVTDYYAVRAVDARQAFYVVGSDVFGPMGKELVPFGKRLDAEEFLRDHRGRGILRFDEIHPAVLASLE
jgi:copper chaperone NosL